MISKKMYEQSVVNATIGKYLGGYISDFDKSIIEAYEHQAPVLTDREKEIIANAEKERIQKAKDKRAMRLAKKIKL